MRTRAARRASVARSASGAKSRSLACAVCPALMNASIGSVLRDPCLDRGNEGPVVGVGAALADPAAQELALRIGERLLGILRRHGVLLVVDADEHLAVLRGRRGRWRGCHPARWWRRHSCRAAGPFFFFVSGPWQAKHLLERMGRISRAKSTGGSAAPSAGRHRLTREIAMQKTRLMSFRIGGLEPTGN